ncbi:hypothetical protein GCM10020258_46360 [Sphingomonas yabuuchiae]
MACHPEQPFTAAQEARLREIAREEIDAAAVRKRLEQPVLQMVIEDGCFIGFEPLRKLCLNRNLRAHRSLVDADAVEHFLVDALHRFLADDAAQFIAERRDPGHCSHRWRRRECDDVADVFSVLLVHSFVLSCVCRISHDSRRPERVQCSGWRALI